jgi:actin-like ATPase involved in cell morphogenesis
MRPSVGAVASAIFIVLTASGDIANAQQEAEPGALVATVTNDNGTTDSDDDSAVAGVKIQATDGSDTTSCTTGASGACSMFPVSTGEWSVTLETSTLSEDVVASSSTQKSVDVPSGGPGEAEFFVKPRASASSNMAGWLLAAGGVAVLAIAAFLVAQRRRRPPAQPAATTATTAKPTVPAPSPPPAPTPALASGYELGVDIGTTFTAAAVLRNGAQRPEMVTLGTRAAAVPSVVLVREDGSILIGEDAEQRATTSPDRVARAFKRRMGDPTPIFLGGSPWSAEALTGALLREVLYRTAQREGAWPNRVVVTHPANWGSYKLDVLKQATRLADVHVTYEFLSEPEAAAIHYASQARVETGTVICVYDLGGGTFDATAVTKTAEGWRQLGMPEGIERLGGLDFDAAIFEKVRSDHATQFDALDPDDLLAIAAASQVRAECTRGKEALSSDTDATINLALPTGLLQTRLTRSEFEALIKPQLLQTIAAVQRAITSAKLNTQDVASVLLVGGSSRIPLVGEILASELHRPVVADAHPKHAVASGAAMFASTFAASSSVARS